jgi:DNA-binding beta-propeller fold protein YncE/tetratricopeptide (TPR) repeat protein
LLVFWDLYRSRLRWAPLRVLEMSTFDLDPDLRLLAMRWQRFRLPRPASAMVKPSSRLEVSVGRFRQPTLWSRTILNPEAGWAAVVQKLPTEQGHALRFLDPRSSAPLGETVLLNGDQNLGMAASPDGKKVAVTYLRTGLLAGWVQVVSAPSGKAILPPLEHTNYPGAVAFSPDGQRLAVGDYNRQVLIWDLTTGKLAQPPIQETDIITAVAWSPDGRILAVGTTWDYSKQPHFRLWDVTSGKPLFVPEFTDHPVDALMFSPDGSVVVATSRERAWILDVATGQLRGPPVTLKPLNTCSISTDGQLLALGSGSGKVAVIQLRTGQLLTGLGGLWPVTAVAFSSDSRTLAVACHDGTVRLIDLATQLPLGPPFVHATAAVEVRCEAKNQALVVATADGHVYRWSWPKSPNLPDHDLFSLLKAFTGMTLEETGPRVLTPDEWRKCYLSLPMSVAHNQFGQRLKDKEWFDLRAREAEDENRPEPASFYLDRLLALQPDDPFLLLRRARNQFLLDDRLGAELDAKRAIWLLERNGAAAPFTAETWHLNEMVRQWLYGRRELALWHADWLNDHAGSYSSLWQSACIYRRIGLVPLAASCEQKALAMGLPPHLKYELALRFAEERKWEEAKSLMQQALAESTPPLLMISRIAVVLARLGLAEPTPSWLENLVEAMETRASGGWVRTHVWTLITLPCPSEWRLRALARVDALKPPPSEPLAKAYDTAAGALLIRLGQVQAGAARIQAALPDLDVRAKPSALAMLALAALDRGDLTSARQYYDEAHVLLKGIDSFWVREGAELLLEEVKQRLPSQ